VRVVPDSGLTGGWTRVREREQKENDGVVAPSH